MSNIRHIDMSFLDKLFRMEGGYVLDFVDRTFTQFFAEELDINIDDPIYAQKGTSKAKRLRCFLLSVDDATAVRTLNALWECREAIRQDSNETESVNNAHGRFLALIDRLSGNAATASTHGVTPMPAFNKQKIAQIKNDLLGLMSLAPQARGYAFEKFLKDLFDIYGLDAREPFRIQGEQIDGSFQLGQETYLIEASGRDYQ